MMSSQRTPGPWVVRNSDTVYSQFNDRLIADCEVTPHDKRPRAPRIQDEANARLIAAAPELLEACKSALESLQWHVQQDANLNSCAEDDIIGHGDITSLLDAIAKAEGRTA